MRPSRSSIVTLFATLVVVAGCSSGGATATGTPASNPTATSGAQGSTPPGSSGAQGSDAPAVSSPSQPAAGGSLPSDPCQLVTLADVSSIYGGDVNALGLDQNGNCSFEINGQAKAGKSAASGEFAVSFGDSWSSYDDAKTVFGSDVVKIDGLGTDAYSYGGFIHARVGSGELVVGGVWVGDYDRTMLATETSDMAKLLLGRL